MATLVPALPTAEQRERLFFLVMALFVTALVIAAFELFLLAGISSFASPWWVHVHALTFMTWVGLYLAQNTLVFRDNIEAHRRLGRFMAGWACWMLVVGLVLTALTVQARRFPPFFDPVFFLALDWVNISVFAGLMLVALLRRKQTDWHRRLMLCATLCVMIPAWGRLMVLARLPVTAWTLILPPITCIGAAMVFDWANRHRSHPAYLWGIGSHVGMAVAISVLVAFPPFITLAGKFAG